MERAEVAEDAFQELVFENLRVTAASTQVFCDDVKLKPDILKSITGRITLGRKSTAILGPSGCACRMSNGLGCSCRVESFPTRVSTLVRHTRTLVSF